MSETSPVEMTHDLGHYLRPLRRHNRLVALCVLAGFFLGIAAAILKSPTYTASSKVYVIPDIVDQAGVNPSTGRTSLPVNMDSEAQFATSLATATTASDLLHGTASPGKLLSRMSVTVAPNSQFMKISYSAHSTSAAIDGANALATAYLQDRQKAAEDYQSSRVAALEARRSEAQKQLVMDQAAYGNSTPHTSVAHRLSIAISNDQKLISGLTDQLTPLQSGSTIPGNLTSKAVLGGSSPNQGRIMYVLGGLVLGVLVGVAAAAARERFDKTVRYEDDLARDGVRLLAEIRPRRRGQRKGEETEALARARAVQKMAAAIGAALGDGGGSIYLAELSRVAMDDRIDEQLAGELSRFGSTTEIVTLGASPTLHRRPTRHAQVLAAAPESEPSAPEHTAPEPAAPEPVEAASNGAAAHAIDTAELITPEDYYASNSMLGWPVPKSAVAVVELPKPAPVSEPEPEPVREVAVVAPAPVTVEPVDEDEPFDATTALLQQVQAGLGRARYVILTGSDVPHGSEAYVLASLSQVTVIVAETGVTQRSALTEAIEQIEITPSRVLGGLLWRPWSKDTGKVAPSAPARSRHRATKPTQDGKSTAPSKERMTGAKSR
ncbi:MAG: hypothetical protein JO214_00870 [Frankiaceae bacterium]|nr:hypothetical protein [Frankiaceae bacterium]